MARILSRNLIRSSQTLTHDPPISSTRSAIFASRLITIRLRSKRPEKAQLFEVDLGSDEAGSGPDLEFIGVRGLQDLVHGILVRRSAPDWLPFMPGTSYWVPPKKRPVAVLEMGGKNTRRPVMEEEAMPFSSIRGWPSSSYFLKGLKSTDPMDTNSEYADSTSDDED